MSNYASYYEFDRKEMSTFLPADYTKVLEVGCGAGNFRKNLVLKNEYWGIEPVEVVASHAMSQLDNVLIGSYENVYSQIPDNYFDLIICNDVIEHMVDYDYFFESIKSKMKKNGVLIASIPNVRYISNLFYLLIKKDWKYTDSGILDKLHLRFFTKKSILRIVIGNGWIVEKIFGINPYKPKSFLYRCAYGLASLLLGFDIKYLEFGIQIRQK